MKRLLVDVDEVLADFQTPVLAVVAELFGKQYKAADFDTWDIFEFFSLDERDELFKRVGAPGFCLGFQPIEGALEAIQEIRKTHHVTPVTRPFPSPTWVHDRATWLAQHFDFKASEIVHTAAKQLVHGDALLDDSPPNVVSWKETHPNGLGMLWHLPNTRNLTQYDHLRVQTWAEVVEKVQAL